jgi:PIN domain nuclease of toxin-antitoxin system
MNLLLDTHTLIWLLEGDSNLSQTAKAAIENPDNTNFVSIATVWEMAIKVSIGKLEMQAPLNMLKTLMELNGIETLPVSIEHALLVSKLPFYHKDPFDRLLIAQAINENMPLLTRDEKFSHYDVRILW